MKILICCIGVMLVIIVILFLIILKNKKTLLQESRLSDKHLALYLLMTQWIKVKQNGGNLAQYLHKNNYNSIAIYGMNYVGECLLNELEQTNINVLYAIDKNAKNIFASIPVVSPNDKLDDVDAIVVTPITAYEPIFNELSKIVDCPIVSIEDLIFELF